MNLLLSEPILPSFHLIQPGHRGTGPSFSNLLMDSITNDPALITGAVPFPADSASIRIIDNTHNKLIAYQGVERIGGTGQTQVPTSFPTTAPATIPTKSPTLIPTTKPTPSKSCINCGPGEGFPESCTAEIRGPFTIRFRETSSPQSNTHAWTFGDGGSARGEHIYHTYQQ